MGNHSISKAKRDSEARSREITVTVKPSESPLRKGRLGEIAEELLRILARARARKRVQSNGPHSDAA